MTEQEKIAARNKERRELCAEYAQNVERREAILARLAELEGEANKAAVAERLREDLEGAARFTQAMMVAPGPAIMPAGVVEDDVGIDGLPGQWNKPVQA